MNFNRNKFFLEYRSQFGSIKQSQVAGIEEILDLFVKLNSTASLQQFAYYLATIKHETANTFKPIREYGNTKYFIKRYFLNPIQRKWLGNKTADSAVRYCGRGYAMITGEGIYTRFAKYIGVDILNYPEKALIPEVAFKILDYGLQHGAFTQGKTLNYYISSVRCDYINARRTVNGIDKSLLIKDYADKFEIILKKSLGW